MSEATIPVPKDWDALCGIADDDELRIRLMHRHLNINNADDLLCYSCRTDERLRMTRAVYKEYNPLITQKLIFRCCFTGAIETLKFIVSQFPSKNSSLIFTDHHIELACTTNKFKILNYIFTSSENLSVDPNKIVELFITCVGSDRCESAAEILKSGILPLKNIPAFVIERLLYVAGISRDTFKTSDNAHAAFKQIEDRVETTRICLDDHLHHAVANIVADYLLV